VSRWDKLDIGQQTALFGDGEYLFGIGAVIALIALVAVVIFCIKYIFRL